MLRLSGTIRHRYLSPNAGKLFDDVILSLAAFHAGRRISRATGFLVRDIPRALEARDDAIEKPIRIAVAMLRSSLLN